MDGGQKGFTLLETILVLVLAAFILGMTTVFFAGYLPSARLNAAAREIAAMVRHERSLARLNGESRTFVLDLDARTYGIEGFLRRPLPAAARVRVIDGTAGEIDRGAWAVSFRRGVATRSGEIVLSSGKKVLRIGMDPVTGAVRIAE